MGSKLSRPRSESKKGPGSKTVVKNESKKGTVSTIEKDILHSSNASKWSPRVTQVYEQDALHGQSFERIGPNPSRRVLVLDLPDTDSGYYHISSDLDDLGYNGYMGPTSIADTEYMSCERGESNKRRPISLRQRVLVQPSIRSNTRLVQPSIPSNTILVQQSIPSNTRSMQPSIPSNTRSVLPPIPSSTTLVQPSIPSTTRLLNISQLAYHTESSYGRVAEPSCELTTNSDDRAGFTGFESMNERKYEPSSILCESIESFHGNGATAGLTLKSDKPSPQKQIKWKSAGALDDNQIIDNPDLIMERKDSTSCPLSISEMPCLDQSIDTYCYTTRTQVRSNEPSESTANCCKLEAVPINNESENSASCQVPSQNLRNDNVQTDFNRNNDVLVGTDAHTTAKHPRLPADNPYAFPRPKAQAVVGPTSVTRVQGGVVLYPVQAGTKRTLSGATIEVPTTLSRDIGCIEVGWSSNAAEFPVLALGQHPITKILHCLPHGSIFISPVVISVNLPVIEGQIEIYYSPTDVGQTPVWTKLRAVDAPANTHFTDDRNVVTLDRDRRVARFELHHFCLFFIVENDRLVEAKKTKATVLLKNEFAPNCCNVIVRVVLGCLEDPVQQKMMKKLRDFKSEGFRVLDDIEFDLVASELKSTISVRISQIQWIPPGDITHGNIDPEEFGLHRLWNQGTVGVMFWQQSEMTNGVQPKSFAATIHIQQDDRQDMRTKIFCSLECPLPLKDEQQTMPVNDYALIQRCDKLAKDFPSFMPSGAAVAPRSCSSSCWSDNLDVVDLHSDSSETEPKAAAPVKNFDQQQVQQKDIEVRKAIKL